MELNAYNSIYPFAIAVPIEDPYSEKESDDTPSAPPLSRLSSSLLSDEEWKQVANDRFQRLSPHWNVSKLYRQSKSKVT